MLLKLRKNFLVVLMLCLTLFTSIPIRVNATQVNSTVSAFNNLHEAIMKGETTCSANSPYASSMLQSKASNSYKKQDGGYMLYAELVSNDPNLIINEVGFQSLTASSKQKFLKDVFTVCQAAAWETDNNTDIGKTTGVTSETVTNVYNIIQQRQGAGSQMLATILQDTAPDYVTANKIYKPFSGLIGTALGLISILIMSLLGLTMALDIAYIVIPAVQLILDGDKDGGGQGGSSGMSKLVSQAARSAVNAAEGGGNGQTGSGNKMALGVYFKYRWKELIVLGICLLYLVQGQIYSFVAWVLDLVSGFLGF